METLLVILIVSVAVLFLWRSLRKGESCGCDGCSDHDCAAMMERLADLMPPECTDEPDGNTEQKKS